MQQESLSRRGDNSLFEAERHWTLCLCEEYRSLVWKQVARLPASTWIYCGDSRLRRSTFYGALLYSLLRMEPCHKIYSACSWLSGRKPAVFPDILIILFKMMCLTVSFLQALGYWERECIPYFQYIAWCWVCGSTEADFMYIIFLSSGYKHCLIVIGRDEIAERAFWVTQNDSSYLLASGYIIHFWVGRNEFWENKQCGRKVEGRREILAEQEKDKMDEADGWFQERRERTR